MKNYSHTICRHSGKIKIKFEILVVVLQSLNCVQLFENTWTAGHQVSLSFTIFWSLLKLLSTESGMPSNHLTTVIPFSSCPQSFPVSGYFLISLLFASGGHSIGAYFSISPSNEYSGLIPFRIDWFDLLAAQGTLQEFSPASHFESITSSRFSLFYGPTLTSIHDYSKNHSFD